jgi:hypothetical protein
MPYEAGAYQVAHNFIEACVHASDNGGGFLLLSNGQRLHLSPGIVRHVELHELDNDLQEFQHGYKNLDTRFIVGLGLDAFFRLP